MHQAKRGFTLVELLAVIVILSVIALIITPAVLNQIEQSKRAGFINSAKNVLDSADIYVSNDHKLEPDGTSVKVLEVKNKETVSGLVFQNQNADYVLKDFTNGFYCASGTRNDLIVRKGDCTNETNLYPNVILSVKDKTTRKITVKVDASDDTGISQYDYCIADCITEGNWKTSNQSEYTFDSLRYSKSYEVQVRVTNKIDKVTEKTIAVTTLNLPTASYNVSPSGWQVTKTVSITYPNDYENYILIHNGRAKINGTIVQVGERIKIHGISEQVIFETNGSIEAITSDGYNEASSSTLTISQVDSTPPEQVSVGIGTVTSKSIQVIANGVDKESGITKYEFQMNGGSWVDNGTNNTYVFDHLTSGTYTYKVRLTNKTGLATTSEEMKQATTSIQIPTYRVSPSGWATSKTADITYQTGYTNQFKVLSGSATYNGNLVSNNTWVTIPGRDASIVFHTNGAIEARSTDSINMVTASTLTISQIDTIAPVINSISIKSTNGNYNATATTITSSITDNSGSTFQMYLSNTGYEIGGIWETYSSSKAWNVGGSLNGGTRTIYITYKDQAGNKTNRTLSYTVYAECGSGNTTTTYGGWSGCSKSCGGGTQTRSVTIKDNKTAKACSSTTGSQSCNTQSCEPTITPLSNDTHYHTIVPLNDTTAIGLTIGYEYNNTSNKRFFESYTDANMIQYINGQVSIGSKQRILKGSNGSGYGTSVTNSAAVRLNDKQFIMMGSSSTISSSTTIYDSDQTASIIELNGSTFSVKTTTTCPYATVNTNRFFNGIACAGNTCYATTSTDEANYKTYVEYLQLSISGNSINCSVTNRVRQKYEDNYYGDSENKAGTVLLGYKSVSDSDYKEFSMINLGNGNYAYKQVSVNGNGDGFNAPINVMIGGKSYQTAEKYYVINLCKMGSNKFVAYYGSSSNGGYTNLYFYEFNQQNQKVELKYTKNLTGINLGNSAKRVPFGEGACLIENGKNMALVKW